MKLKILIAVIFSILMQSCIVKHSDKDFPQGDGNIITKEIPIKDYYSIFADAPVEIHYVEKPNEEPYLKITADSNIIAFLNPRVKDGILRIGPSNNSIWTERGSCVPTTCVVETNSKSLSRFNIMGFNQNALRRDFHKFHSHVKLNSEKFAIGKGIAGRFKGPNGKELPFTLDVWYEPCSSEVHKNTGCSMIESGENYSRQAIDSLIKLEDFWTMTSGEEPLEDFEDAIDDMEDAIDDMEDAINDMEDARDETHVETEIVERNGKKIIKTTTTYSDGSTSENVTTVKGNTQKTQTVNKPPRSRK